MDKAAVLTFCRTIADNITDHSNEQILLGTESFLRMGALNAWHKLPYAKSFLLFVLLADKIKSTIQKVPWSKETQMKRYKPSTTNGFLSSLQAFSGCFKKLIPTSTYSKKADEGK